MVLTLKATFWLFSDVANVPGEESTVRLAEATELVLTKLNVEGVEVPAVASAYLAVLYIGAKVATIIPISIMN